jgi:hypothetical protein
MRIDPLPASLSTEAILDEMEQINEGMDLDCSIGPLPPGAFDRQYARLDALDSELLRRLYYDHHESCEV